MNTYLQIPFQVEKKTGGDGGELRANIEFHPFHYAQHEHSDAVKEFDTFNAAVDEFFSQMESQKIDMKVAQQEKQALKKLENIKKDHESRLQSLEQVQARDRQCGELIELNRSVYDWSIRFSIKNSYFRDASEFLDIVRKILEFFLDNLEFHVLELFLNGKYQKVS